MWQCIAAFLAGAALAGSVALWIGRRRIRRQTNWQKELLKRTRKAEKLAELGGLFGHLAHEIRNPLSTVKVHLKLLSEDIENLSKTATAPSNDSSCGGESDHLKQRYGRQLRKIATITLQTNRLAETLNDFLRYAGRMELHPVRQDVNEILDELVDFYEPQAADQGVTIRSNFSGKPAFCRVDADLLKQAILNLMVNAVQSTNGQGELIIQSRFQPSFVLIDVIDTGKGISKDEQERIFDAYYTSRPGGTGLGLPTCRRIVEEHGGHIDLHSEPGKGSKFTIVLPLAEERISSVTELS